MYYLPEYPVAMFRVDPWSGYLFGWRHASIDSGRLNVPLPEGTRMLLLLETHPPVDVSAPVEPIDSTGTGLFTSQAIFPPDGQLRIGRYSFTREAPQT
jgi:hypothetical protein